MKKLLAREFADVCHLRGKQNHQVTSARHAPVFKDLLVWLGKLNISTVGTEAETHRTVTPK